MKLSHYYLEMAFNVPKVSTSILYEEDIPNRVSNATNGKTACLLPTNKATHQQEIESFLLHQPFK